MFAKLRPRSAYDVMAALALFLAIAGGTAYATHELILSSDIVDGEVKTPDIANAAVVTDKLAQGAVTSGKVKDDNLVGGDVADGSLTGVDVASNTLEGSDIDESTLDQVPSAELGGKGRSRRAGSCDPDSAAFVDCGFVRLDIPAQNRAAGTRVLMIGWIEGFNEIAADDHGEGLCRLGWSPPDVPGTSLVESATQFSTSSDIGDFIDHGTMIAVTPPIPPGTFDFGIECSELDGGIFFNRPTVSAVALSPG